MLWLHAFFTVILAALWALTSFSTPFFFFAVEKPRLHPKKGFVCVIQLPAILLLTSELK